MTIVPYTRLRLSVTSDSFVLRPYSSLEDVQEGSVIPDQIPVPTLNKDSDGIRISFQPTDTSTTPLGPPEGDLPEEQPKRGEVSVGRVSFVLPGSSDPPQVSRDYVIYGCIGLLDLYTGPHLIVIASVKALGEIEDKPVFAINKVAVLPMDGHDACQVLNRFAQSIEPTLTSQDSRAKYEQFLGQMSATLVQDTVSTGEDPASPGPKSTKVTFSFLRPQSPSTSTQEAAAPIAPSSKRISFGDLPRFSLGNRSSTSLTGSRPPTSPPLSPDATPSPSGFFAKLKDSILDKKSQPTIDTERSSTEGLPITSTVDDSTPQVASHPAKLCQAPQEKEEHTGSDSLRSETNGSSPTTTSDKDNGPAPEKAPTGLDAAEMFMTNATKQLTNWGEAAVSGVFKSSTSINHSKEKPAHASDGSLGVPVESSAVDGEDEMDRNRSLDRRVIREISTFFGTGFYFSTEFNLLSSMQKRSEGGSMVESENVPLWSQVDKRFWWNEHLQKELLALKAHRYIIPIMQGYVEIEQCVIEEQPFEFTLISRRSRERSGLRYQRRGIDADGNTANFVETEQLVRIVRNDSDHQVSFVQTRGSIPLFWSQSPYRLKPVPILERSEQENDEGFKKHIGNQVDQYGRQILINLVEQHGRELVAGSAYTRYAGRHGRPDMKYVEFDFHEQCKGMKYENIERLIKSLETEIQELGYCWLAPRRASVAINSPQEDQKGHEHTQRLYDQKGVIRTNCMDCLDRTNVVQSAVGRYILNRQLLRLGIASFPDKGLSVYEEFENVFNNVWANNGDAISREYAGTSALKGDFTRTGKRNLQGMVNDATNSVARMFYNTFKDYFRQAIIDYLLGHADVNVFKNIQTTAFGTAIVPPPILPPIENPDNLLPSLLSHSESTGAISVSAASVSSSESTMGVLSDQEERVLQHETWARIREAAIETSAEIVISPGEEQWKGWTFICCSNEVSSALRSASSPPTSPQSTQRLKKAKNPASESDAQSSQGASKVSAVFYDEKIVLLTEKALYICTYDYEMEKVLEFWRLALEKMTGIDKGVFFLSAAEKTLAALDPLENYGFAIIYRTNATGETMRVNSGSVRNRRKMGGLTPSDSDLERVLEVDEDTDEPAPLHMEPATVEESRLHPGKVGVGSEPKDLRSVKFKIVKHPETSIVPFATASSGDSGQDQANPSTFRRTAQDCVEWVVTEIVKARCELIDVSENVASLQNGTPARKGHSGHGRSPSEEYNYSPLQDRKKAEVQVDLVLRDRVLQSLETAAELEQGALKRKGTKKSDKKPFARLFSKGRNSNDGAHVSAAPRSWLAKAKSFQFGMDTEDDTDEEEEDERERGRLLTKETKEESGKAGMLETGDAGGSSSPASSQVSRDRSGSRPERNSGQSVFAKFRQAVKNF